MPEMDRDLRLGGFVVVLGFLICGASFTMPSRGGLMESPGIFPGLMGLLLILFGAILAGRSLGKGGRVRLARWGRSFTPFLTSKEHRPVILGILFPAVYVFMGIPLLGFYPSSALFMAIMFFAFVKSWRRWAFLPVSLGVTALLYLIFTELFMLQIR
jgi:hypothetical protein